MKSPQWCWALGVALALVVGPVVAKDAPPSALELGNQALMALKNNDVASAARWVNEGLRKAPNEASLLELAALIAERQQQTAVAARHWAHLALVEPENERLLRERAGFECRTGDARDGEHAFRVLAERFPERAAASWLAAAQCAELGKDGIVATVDYKKVLELLADDPDALLGLARIAVGRGQYEAAAKQLNQLLTTVETPSEEALVLMIRTQKALNHAAMVVRYQGDLMRLFPESKALRSAENEGMAR